MVARMPLAWPLAAVAGFAVLLLLTAAGWPPLESFDAALSQAARRYGAGHPGVIAWLRVATDIAATVPYLVAGGTATALLAVRRQRPAAVCCAAVTVVVPVLWSVLHLTLYRPRPEAGFVTVTSNGFPSGHTANAAAAGLLVVLLLWPRLGRRGRAAAVSAAVALAVFVGATRVLLLVHWPVDVLGGWLLAGGVVPLLGWAAMARETGRRAVDEHAPWSSESSEPPGRPE